LLQGPDRLVGLGTNNVVSGGMTGGLPNPVSFSASCDHVLMLDPSGSLTASGSNDAGQLGDGTFATKNNPQPIMQNLRFGSVSAGLHGSAAIETGGNVWAWGNGKATPTVVFNNAKQITSGTQMLTVLKTDGSVWVQRNQQAFKSIDGMRDIQKISSRGNHVLALRADGTVWAWGSNNTAQLGPGSETDQRH
jgi:alpha-tubulin suppressor-like RCC1 family protein